MTEENKPQKNRIFYWLGAFIIVGLLALSGQYLYWKFISGNVREPVNHALAYQDTKLSSAIKDYGQWSAALADKKMDVSHELTKTGLDKIANVLTLMSAENSVTQDNNAIHTDINRIHGLADSITYNWKSGKHADMIKLAFVKLTKVISNMGYSKIPSVNHEVLELELKAGAIDPKILTLDQRSAVKAAFAQASSVFEKTQIKPTRSLVDPNSSF